MYGVGRLRAFFDPVFDTVGFWLELVFFGVRVVGAEIFEIKTLGVASFFRDDQAVGGFFGFADTL